MGSTGPSFGAALWKKEKKEIERDGERERERQKGRKKESSREREREREREIERDNKGERKREVAKGKPSEIRPRLNSAATKVFKRVNIFTPGGALTTGKL